ncbi:S8 family peptidase [Aeromonas enteropelogenes]|uniref:S8 family peptidase n=1 Tax=Aeromonas enteropelogenes TaxID=29489 RepID=UPI003F742E00
MKNKNLLLGYGETLTRKVTIKSGSGNKNVPYTYEENKPYIMENIKSFLETVDEIPDSAKPNGEAVAKIYLHPAFLAKTYFPSGILNEFSLRSIGSKAITINPRKQANKKPVYNSACIYVSGKAESFQQLYDTMNNGRLKKTLQKEIASLEVISMFSSDEKIKEVDSSDNKRTVEVALHTPEHNNEVIDSFIRYATKCGASIKEEKIISVKGLTFLPISANATEINNIASFTFLRTIRDLPAIRFNTPIITRAINSDSPITAPSGDAINKDIRVAVFDGGIGCSDFNKWVNEYTFTNNVGSNSELLSHGQNVTSTLLFGPISQSQQNLPTPYTNIDHYRVLDDSIDGGNIDLFDVLLRITKALDSKTYDYVNLSLGPRLPVDDDDVHVWTSTLEQYFASGKTLCTVAVGNDGRASDGLNRIQPPSDLVNALAVGAATSLSEQWEKCDYSCIGPGRSPGFVKPDGIAFGGSQNEPFVVYSPFTKGTVHTGGTSFASPLVLRQAIGLASTLQYDITPLTAKAMLIHHAKNNNSDKHHVGWGRFPHEIDDMIYCEDDEVKVVYQGILKPSQHMRASIPYPDIALGGDVTLKATFCFTTPVDAEHPLNYTRSGLVVTLRKKHSERGNTFTFFNSKSIYSGEQEQREDAHKWETTLHKEHTFRRDTLDEPCFDIIYYGREGGMPVEVADLPDLPYVLIVSLKAKDTPDLYNNIRQRYQTLQPIQIKQDIRIQV